MFEQYFAPKGSDKICVMTTRLACIELLRARIGEWNNNLDVGFLMGYVLTGYRLNLNSWIWILFPMIRICTPSLLTS